MADHLDVLIVGAGLSGIGAAHHVQERLPHKRYAILEARDAIGGTWDLFRYPGIRSDSDMHTLGYRFRPWVQEKAIADGSTILDYVRDTAREDGSDRHIRFGHRVTAAAWSLSDARWTVRARQAATGETVTLTCSFLLICSGYFRYDEPYTPEFAGRERFGGTIVHPQRWPEELDHTGKRVVVIGSGATAITLVPALARDAEHVTMLQRSPTYIVSLPARDDLANRLRRRLGARAAYPLVRWRNVVRQLVSYGFMRRFPRQARALLRRVVEAELPAGYDVDAHFKPRYDPWDQRLCLVPDGDLFRALGSGRAEVVTDHIRSFTETGIELESGVTLEADVIVTATGLNLLALGDVDFSVDGRAIVMSEAMAYKGMMFEGVPNMAFTVGYTNASWTLKADLTSEFVCRLLRHMDRTHRPVCTPRNHDATVTTEPFMDFMAGYVLRALDRFPKQGSKPPWRLRQNYLLDIFALRHGALEDGAMTFSTPPAA